MLFQKSPRFDLAGEIKSWIDDGVIDADQGRQIASRYDFAADDQAAVSRGTRTVSLLAFLCVGVAALILIGQNWDEIPRSVRVVGLLAVTLGVNSFGLKQFLSTQPEKATAWFLFGSICYGSAIMLIGQIFHLGEHYSTGVYLWAIGVLPIAYIVNHSTLWTLAMALATLWFCLDSEQGNFGETYILFIAALAVRLLEPRSRPSLAFLVLAAVAVYLQVFAGFAFNFWSSSRPGAENLVILVGTLVVYLALARLLASRNSAVCHEYATALSTWLLHSALVFLFVFTYFRPWERLLNARFERPGLLVAVVVGLTLLSVIIWYLARRNRTIADGLSDRLVLVACGLYVIGGIVLAGGVATGSIEGSPLWCQIGSVLLAFVFGTYLIVLGVRQRDARHYYTGIGFVLLLVITRYFELVGDYVTTSALFAVAGLILFATNHYWRNRFTTPTEAHG